MLMYMYICKREPIGRTILNFNNKYEFSMKIKSKYELHVYESLHYSVKLSLHR